MGFAIMANGRRMTMRPIDADALRNVFDAMHAIAGGSHLDHLVLLGIKKYIDDAPTIDAVKVVRCRECKHSRPLTKGLVACLRWNRAFICDGFCHDGAKIDAKDMNVPTKDGGADNG